MKGYMTWLHIECRQILVQENRYNNHLIFIRLNVRLTECNINSLGSLHVNLAPFHMWSYLKSICIHLQHENVTKSRIHENLYPHTNYRFENISIQIVTVDCQSAGNGDLEVFVTFRGSKVHCNLTQTQTGLYTASYLPYTCGTYHISVSFNKSEIRGRFLTMFHVSLLRQILQYQCLLP